ncbi:tail fiber assembly protein [Paraburkholderia sp. MM5477-R1]|uniref:tail fiber assembly protein n=1 Tax=Paraburkholderia sp. MM5477-R1 TaxID=2991062 RepID=UPI003D1F4A91
MKNLVVNGLYSHDLMYMVMQDLYPELKTGRDYTIGHPIDPATGEQIGDPDFMSWALDEKLKPDIADLKAHFQANEASYRATFARKYRDACLDASDGRATVTDAPAGSKAANMAQAWHDYRQALRDVPQQPGFPLDIDWPERPE